MLTEASPQKIKIQAFGLDFFILQYDQYPFEKSR